MTRESVLSVEEVEQLFSSLDDLIFFHSKTPLSLCVNLYTTIYEVYGTVGNDTQRALKSYINCHMSRKLGGASDTSFSDVADSLCVELREHTADTTNGVVKTIADVLLKRVCAVGLLCNIQSIQVFL